jgi:hypothetical protein
MKISTSLKAAFADLISALLLLLFIYTSVSKFLDYDKFVFQMRLAPVPLMQTLAPILGWLMPVVEILIAIALAAGFFYYNFKIIGLYSSVILLIIFEIYIGTMLLSGSHLPCTCGGIVSQMGWKQHLSFNAFLIIGCIFSLKYLKIDKTSGLNKNLPDTFKILSRA